MGQNLGISSDVISGDFESQLLEALSYPGRSGEHVYGCAGAACLGNLAEDRDKSALGTEVLNQGVYFALVGVGHPILYEIAALGALRQV